MEPVKVALVPMTCRLGFGVCDIRFFSGPLSSVAEDNPIVGLIGLSFSITTDNLPLLGDADVMMTSSSSSIPRSSG